MKKLVLAVSLGLASNAYALDAEKETLWVMQQVSAMCSAHDIGEMADDYWDVVKDIQYVDRVLTTIPMISVGVMRRSM